MTVEWVMSGSYIYSIQRQMVDLCISDSRVYMKMNRDICILNLYFLHTHTHTHNDYAMGWST